MFAIDEETFASWVSRLEQECKPCTERLAPNGGEFVIFQFSTVATKDDIELTKSFVRSSLMRSVQSYLDSVNGVVYTRILPRIEVLETSSELPTDQHVAVTGYARLLKVAHRKSGVRFAVMGDKPWVECSCCQRVIPQGAMCPCETGFDPMRVLLEDGHRA